MMYGTSPSSKWVEPGNWVGQDTQVEHPNPSSGDDHGLDLAHGLHAFERVPDFFERVAGAEEVAEREAVLVIPQERQRPVVVRDVAAHRPGDGQLSEVEVGGADRRGPRFRRADDEIAPTA